MEHTFSEVPRAEIPRSTFNRSHRHATTFDADYLVPVFIDEVLPGDTFRMDCSMFARLATPLHPIMDNIYLEMFWFYTPTRLLWENWERFLGAQDDPTDSIDYTVPKLGSGTTFNIQTADPLFMYMGLPYVSSADLNDFNSLPFRAYNKIWNWWFRDQNLQNSLSEINGDGPDGTAAYVLKLRNKRHDYFTSCIPWPQKGDAVSLPLGTRAPVASDVPNTSTDIGFWASGLGTPAYRNLSASTTVRMGIGTSSEADALYADLQDAAAATINDLRLAFQLQRLLERDARSGTRSKEVIKAHFGVDVPDYRLQQPEFLGGGSTRVNVNSVPNTSDTATANQGDLAGYGTASDRNGFTKSFVEHGYLIGLVNARADITYQRGLERFWSRNTRYDFYYPVLSQIGEQAVLNSEIFYTNTSTDDDVFGYQERYAEYKYKPSRISGAFLSSWTGGSLHSWHLSENLTSLPTLGGTFIRSNAGTPLDRAIAVPTEPHFIADFYFDLKCTRPMPLYGVPGNLDHF